MRIAVDAHNLLTDRRGIGRYVRTLLRAWLEDRELDLTLLLRVPVPWTSRRRIAAMLGSVRFAQANQVPSNADVVWHPWNGTFFPGSPPSVVTMHDAMPFTFPNADPKRRAREQEPFLRSARTARLVIAVSAAGAREIVARVGVPEDRVRVIRHGVAPVFSPGAPPRGGQGYLFFVGDAANENKGFASLHGAYVRAWPQGDGPPLVVLGESVPWAAGVRFFSPVFEGGAEGEADLQLRDLYRGAIALCVPSRSESFAMPVVEAMSCGTPVLASRVGAIPEIADAAALLLEPGDEEAWALALRAVVRDEAVRAHLRDQGIQRARAFSWERCAAQTLAVLREAAFVPTVTR